MGAKPAAPNNRLPRKELIRVLLRDGRRVICEVPGCGVMDHTILDVHHVTPVSVQPIHHANNLVFLCSDHHNLVERFYFQTRQKLMPDITREIKEVARQFQLRSLRYEQVPAAQERTKELWTALNGHPECRKIEWWRATYKAAVKWAAQQETIFSVPSESIITADPWFRERQAQAA